jgi:hypothetical protein
MPDYEKIADAACPDEAAAPSTPEGPFDPNKGYLPVDHEKYQGLADAKGYKQGEDYSGHRLSMVRNIHEAMIDFMVLNPGCNNNDIAKQFDRHPNWVSILIGSDSFQAALAKRRDDLLDPVVVASIEEKMRGMVSQSVDIVMEKLGNSKSADLAFKAMEIGTKALGFGARTAGPNQNNQFIIQLPPKAESSEDWNKTYNAESVRRLPSTGTED